MRKRIEKHIELSPSDIVLFLRISNCSKNKKTNLKSRKCWCFYCKKTFLPKEIRDWVCVDPRNGNATALCPRCGIDSVVGDACGYPLNKKVIEGMSYYFFSPRYATMPEEWKSVKNGLRYWPSVDEEIKLARARWCKERK